MKQLGGNLGQKIRDTVRKLSLYTQHNEPCSQKPSGDSVKWPKTEECCHLTMDNSNQSDGKYASMETAVSSGKTSVLDRRFHCVSSDETTDQFEGLMYGNYSTNASISDASDDISLSNSVAFRRNKTSMNSVLKAGHCTRSPDGDVGECFNESTSPQHLLATSNSQQQLFVCSLVEKFIVYKRIGFTSQNSTCSEQGGLGVNTDVNAKTKKSSSEFEGHLFADGKLQLTKRKTEQAECNVAGISSNAKMLFDGKFGKCSQFAALNLHDEKACKKIFHPHINSAVYSTPSGVNDNKYLLTTCHLKQKMCIHESGMYKSLSKPQSQIEFKSKYTSVDYKQSYNFQEIDNKPTLFIKDDDKCRNNNQFMQNKAVGSNLAPEDNNLCNVVTKSRRLDSPDAYMSSLRSCNTSKAELFMNYYRGPVPHDDADNGGGDVLHGDYLTLSVLDENLRFQNLDSQKKPNSVPVFKLSGNHHSTSRILQATSLIHCNTDQSDALLSTYSRQRSSSSNSTDSYKKCKTKQDEKMKTLCKKCQRCYFSKPLCFLEQIAKTRQLSSTSSESETVFLPFNSSESKRYEILKKRKKPRGFRAYNVYGPRSVVNSSLARRNHKLSGNYSSYDGSCSSIDENIHIFRSTHVLCCPDRNNPMDKIDCLITNKSSYSNNNHKSKLLRKNRKKGNITSNRAQSKNIMPVDEILHSANMANKLSRFINSDRQEIDSAIEESESIHLKRLSSYCAPDASKFIDGRTLLDKKTSNESKKHIRNSVNDKPLCKPNQTNDFCQIVACHDITYKQVLCPLPSNINIFSDKYKYVDEKKTNSLFADDEDEITDSSNSFKIKESYVGTCTVYNSSIKFDKIQTNKRPRVKSGKMVMDDDDVIKDVDLCEYSIEETLHNACEQVHDIFNHLRCLRRQMDALRKNVVQNSSLTLSPDTSLGYSQPSMSD